jgi:hypothetical protein
MSRLLTLFERMLRVKERKKASYRAYRSEALALKMEVVSTRRSSRRGKRRRR